MAGQISDKITGVYGVSIDYTDYLPTTRELNVQVITTRTMSVNANNHATLFRMQYENGNADIPIVVTVGTGVSNDSGDDLVAPGSCIIFSQETFNNITFQTDAGITILSPGELKAYGKNSTVTLISLDGYTWILGGDVKLSEVFVDG